jgi:hypothetical protein
MPPGRTSCSTPRAQASALQKEEIPFAKIKEITGLAKSTIYHIKQIAFEKGYDRGVCREFKMNTLLRGSGTGLTRVLTRF